MRHRAAGNRPGSTRSTRRPSTSTASPIVASDKVSDYALKEAAFVIGRMLEGRRDLIDVLVASKVNVAVMATSERTVDIPEHRDLKPGLVLEPPRQGPGRADRQLRRGEPAQPGRRPLRRRERPDPRVRPRPPQPRAGEARSRLQQEAPGRLRRRPQAKGLWKGTYAASDIQEYWAEGVQSWFDTNRHDDRAHNHVHTRAGPAE